MNTNTQVVTVEFHGQPMIAVKNGDEIYVAMKPITEAIGLQWEAQLKRIKRHPVMVTCMSMMDIQMPGDDQRREVATLPLKMLNGWLFGIDTNRVKPECRDKLIEYQTECFDVLASYFMQGEAINPRMQYSVGPNDTLTKEQADTLRNLLTESAKQRFPDDTKKQGAFIMRGWSKMKAHFKVGYREIPAIEFTEALSLAARHAAEGEYLPRDEHTSLNQIVAKWVKQIEAGNGTPIEVFEPLVKAVLKKRPSAGHEAMESLILDLLCKQRFSLSFIPLEHGLLKPQIHTHHVNAQTLVPQAVINDVRDRSFNFFPDALIPDLINAIGDRMAGANRSAV